MFDPRMMAPDGSSYQRPMSALAPLAATSGMAVTPPGVQTIGGPQPNALGSFGNGRQMKGANGPGPGGQWGQTGFSDWRNAMMDWRQQRPQFQMPAGGFQGDWRSQVQPMQQQFQDWRALRPTPSTFFTPGA